MMMSAMDSITRIRFLVCLFCVFAVVPSQCEGLNDDPNRQTESPLPQTNFYDWEHQTDFYKRGAFYIRLDKKSKECRFHGYKPNGPVMSVGQIKAPKATLGMKSGLQKLLGGGQKLGKGAAVAMHAMKFSKALMKNAPMLGPALGVFSAASGMINPKPTPDDILKAVNTAVEKLTSEVNRKLTQMEGYVDSKIAKLEKELIKNEFSASFKLWANCVKEPTKALVDECQRDSVKFLLAKKSKFVPLEAELSVRRKNKRVSYDKVRKLEAYLLAFRDYANLVVMQLTPLIQLYCDKDNQDQHALHYCNVYSDDLKKEATSFISYARNAVEAIKQGHWGRNKQGNCPDTFKCDNQKQIKEGFWGAHTANSQKCSCEIESSNSKKYCEISFTIRVDGKHVYPRYYYHRKNGFNNGGREFGRRFLTKAAYKYQVQNHKIMAKFWQEEVLNFMPNWKRAIRLANAMKKQKHIAAASQKRIHPVSSQSKNPFTLPKTPFTFKANMVGSQLLCSCQNVKRDIPSMDYSDNFHQRLDASGHQFADLIEEVTTENDAVGDDAYDRILEYDSL